MEFTTPLSSLDPEYAPGDAYVVVSDGKLWLSEDGGKSFQEAPTPSNSEIQK